MKKSEYPKKRHVGPASATIYYTPNKGRDAFTAVYYDLDGNRQRRTFSSPETADEETDSLLRSLMHGHSCPRTISDLDRLVYDRSLNYIKNLGLPLDLVAHEYAEALKLLESTGVSLMEAVRRFRQSTPSSKRRITVKEAVNELLEDRMANSTSYYHIRDLKGRLGRFSDAFECHLDSVTPDEIEDYLRSLKTTSRTVKNHRTTISTLFNFAIQVGLLPKSHPGVRPGPRALLAEREIELFSPKEIEALLKVANPRVLPALAIGAFAGVRSEEVRRLDWAQVKLERGYIEILARIAKKRKRRLAPMPDNLREWLSPHQQTSGLVLTYKNYSNEQLKVSKAANVKWKRNGLRRSFISHRVAATGNIIQTAKEAGNSPQVIETTYLEAVDKTTGEEWFNIRPGDSS